MSDNTESAPIRSEHYARAEEMVKDLLEKIQRNKVSFVLCYRTGEIELSPGEIQYDYETVGIFPAEELLALKESVNEFMTDVSDQELNQLDQMKFPFDKGLPN